MTLLYCHRVLPKGFERRLGPDISYAIDDDSLAAILRDPCIAHWDECIHPETQGVGLTFDDGYHDFIDTALPLIEAAGVRVLMFVTTGFADGDYFPYEYVLGELLSRRTEVVSREDWFQEFLEAPDLEESYRQSLAYLKLKPPEVRQRFLSNLLADSGLSEGDLNLPKMMDWTDIEWLDGHPLVDLGAHTLSHPYLPNQSVLSAWREVRESRSRLESALGKQVSSFAYPYGGHCWWVRVLTRCAGYRRAFATGGSGGSMALPRVDVVEWLNAR